MRFVSASLALAAAVSAAVSTAHGQIRGFNYGSLLSDNSPKQQADFAAEFSAAKQLPGIGGFNSARLYTMIQGNTANSPTQALQAAIDSGTSLLLGLWASAGEDAFNNELAALKAAIAQYGQPLVDVVKAISVGSEDMYRISPTGISNLSGAGADPDTIVRYLQQVRSVIAGTAASAVPVGHVDTWTAWVNGSNAAVVQACDFIGMDAYPYFQTTIANSIDTANQTFYDAFDVTVAAAQGKPVWVTETGWPSTGPTQNQAVASVDNAQTYWKEVACSLFASGVNTWWFELVELPTEPSVNFDVMGAASHQPSYDLSCGSSTALSSTSSTAAMASMASASASSSVGAIAAPTSTPAPAPPSSSPAMSSPPAPSSSSAPSPSPAPTGLAADFAAPHLIVPIDATAPAAQLGNGFVAFVSATKSTLFNFNVPAAFRGRTCSLVLVLPAPALPAVFSLTAPGGLRLSALTTPAVATDSWASAPVGYPVGSVKGVQSNNTYSFASAVCPFGSTVSYRLDSVGGLNLTWFEEIDPAAGLFVSVSG